MCGITSEVLSKVIGISNIEIQDSSLSSAGELIIRVKSTQEVIVCHQCGQPATKPCSPGQEIKLRHGSLLEHPIFIAITPARAACDCCEGNPTTTQKVDWYEPRHSCTNAYEEHLLLSLINSTIQDVSIKEGIGYDVVEGVLERRMGTAIDWSEIKRIDALGIDEITTKKGHKDFVVIVTAFIEGQIRLLAVLKNREKATVKEFFLSIPKRLRKKIRAICSDLYAGFIGAAKEVFGKKIPVIADRFHVAKLYREKLDIVRKQEMRRLKKELPEHEYKKLKNVMWILRKPLSELSEDELRTLRLLFKHSPKLKRAYDLCSDLTNIFDMNITPGQAKRKLGGWIRRARKSGLTCFNSFIKTLSRSMQEITNYFRDRWTSGFVEGLNNKIKVLKRRCYGLTHIGHIFQRIRLDLEGYSIFSHRINALSA